MATDREPAQQPPASTLWTRRIGMLLVLALVAVAPWLVPWGDLFGSSSSAQPAPSVVQPQSDGDGDQAERPRPDQDTVKRLAEQVRGAAGYDLPVSPEEVAGVSTEPGEYRELGQIQIPSIGLDVTYGEGVHEEALLTGPGHWPGTPMPGREGNSVISGHRNTHTQPFKELDVVKPGDEIIIDTGDDPTTYEVTKTTIVPEEEYKDFVLRQPKEPGARELTLFACHPEGNPIFRIVVQAVAS